LTEHRLLTGASLHEPKGVETATSGQVYVADGLGSGSWQSRESGNLLINRLWITGTLTDVSEATSFYYVVPTKATLSYVRFVLAGAITTANSTVTIYKNNIAQTPTIVIPFTGSGPGVSGNAIISPAIEFNEGDVIRVSSDGGSTGSQPLTMSLSFTAVA